MVRSSLTELKEVFLRSWGSSSVAVPLFSALTERFDPDVHRHLTLVALRRMSGKHVPLRDIRNVADYLAGEDVGLLERRFELVEEDDTVEVPTALVSEASSTGVLYHPETGDRIDDWEDRVVPYYVPTQKLKDLRVYS